MSTLKIAWYNLENLFEPLQHPELKEEWTQEHYKNKVKNLASVISKLHNPIGPDLLGICEVQSEEVIQDILNELPNGNEYAIVHHHSEIKIGRHLFLLTSLLQDDRRRLNYLNNLASFSGKL